MEIPNFLSSETNSAGKHEAVHIEIQTIVSAYQVSVFVYIAMNLYFKNWININKHLNNIGPIGVCMQTTIILWLMVLML